jgi:DNA-binding PadR family transcriptional regulator
MRKKYYRITQKGIEALKASKQVNDRIWSEFRTSVKEKP